MLAHQGADYVNDLSKHNWDLANTAADGWAPYANAINNGDYSDLGAMTTSTGLNWGMDALMIFAGTKGLKSSEPGPEEPEPGRPGVDRDDGRDSQGRFTGQGGYGADAEAKGLAKYTTDTGRAAVDTKVQARLPDGSIRYYDGLSLKPDGTWEGIEVKSGTAGRTAGQRAFDGQVDGDGVNPGTPATATLNGKQIRITSTYLINMP